MLSRRDFVKLIALMATGTVGTACALEDFAEFEEEMDTHTTTHSETGSSDRVIIIGAGMSGVAAARTLVDAGYTVKILEARDRIGGRTHTASWDGTPVDLGGSWIHGRLGNPMTRLARQADARTTPTEEEITYGTNGQPLSAQEKELLQSFTSGWGDWLYYGQEEADYDQSLQALLEQIIAEEGLSAEEARLARFYISALIEQDYAGSLQQMSTYWFDEGSGFGGIDLLLVDGYGKIVDHLAQGIDIQLNTPIQTIRWGNDTATIIDQNGESYPADYVIVTLPLGVLKSNTVSFQPSLPAAKQSAISQLGISVFNKCYLRFDEVFWPEDYDWLAYVPEQQNRWPSWLNLDKAIGLPALVGYSTADYGRRLESWSDANIIADAMDVLRTIFGPNIPEPNDSIITRWLSDPYSRGSYSFIAVNSHPSVRQDLAAQVDDTLFFAGEATSSDYPSTVHGAYLSGVRAAEEIINM